MAGANGLFIGEARAVKAIGVPVDFDEYINGLREKSNGATPWDSPWFRAVVRKRADGARSIPRRVMQGEAEIEEHDFDGMTGKPRIDFDDLMFRASISLDRFGAAYFAIVQNARRVPLEVRWLDPSTVEAVHDRQTGRLLRFDRRLNNTIVQSYPYDEKTRRAPGLAWVWSAGMNETGPGDTLTKACELPARTLVMADELMRSLYERGAISHYWVTATHNPPEAEKERLRVRIGRALMGGVKNAHSVEVFNEGLTVTKIGTDPNALELGATAIRLQDDICAAAGTDRILLVGAAATNRATIDRITQTWLQSTIAPHAKNILDALNFHVLAGLGYRIELNTAGMDVDQEEEAEKAAAWAVYVDHDVNAETAAAMLGIDIPEGMEFINEARVAERAAAEQAKADAMREAAMLRANGQGPPVAQPNRREEEVKRLGDHIKSGAYLLRRFTSDVLTPADIEAAIIAAEWEGYP